MEEVDVFRTVDSSIAKNNERLLVSMKSIMESSLTDPKQFHADTVDSHLKEITIEPRRFKKTGNGNQDRFNLKVRDAIEEVKKACSSKQLDKDHAALEKGEKLLPETEAQSYGEQVRSWMVFNTGV